ncbi:MAG: type II toxin-antitoxin system VapC family toxin [Gemmatimonadales bacterium]|nr:MAG: type II toxin-antitoxin system VapC family toxin [Gemmatimonadales bacterium]
MQFRKVPATPALTGDNFYDAWLEQRGLSFADAAIVTVARKSAEGRIATFDGAFRGMDGITVLP